MQLHTVTAKKNEDVFHKMTWRETWQTVFSNMVAIRFPTVHYSQNTTLIIPLLNLFKLVTRTCLILFMWLLGLGHKRLSIFHLVLLGHSFLNPAVILWGNPSQVGETACKYSGCQLQLRAQQTASISCQICWHDFSPRLTAIHERSENHLSPLNPQYIGE